jgi:uncharacterized BrkB/YihY/UPF0761 family membrane protein
MATVLGLLAFVAYVALIVGFAAAVTWLVVRLTPPHKKPKPPGPAGS